MVYNQIMEQVNLDISMEDAIIFVKYVLRNNESNNMFNSTFSSLAERRAFWNIECVFEVSPHLIYPDYKSDDKEQYLELDGEEALVLYFYLKNSFEKSLIKSTVIDEKEIEVLKRIKERLEILLSGVLSRGDILDFLEEVSDKMKPQ